MDEIEMLEEHGFVRYYTRRYVNVAINKFPPDYPSPGYLCDYYDQYLHEFIPNLCAFTRRVELFPRDERIAMFFTWDNVPISWPQARALGLGFSGPPGNLQISTGIEIGGFTGLHQIKQVIKLIGWKKRWKRKKKSQ